MVRATPSNMLYPLMIHLDTSYAFDMVYETNIKSIGGFYTLGNAKALPCPLFQMGDIDIHYESQFIKFIGL